MILSARGATRLGPSSNPLVRATQAVRSTLLRHLLELFPIRRAGLLMGLALGDTSHLDPGDEEHFRATGLGHLVAVSGENVAMVLAPVLGLAMLLRLSARARFGLGLFTVVFFVVLTGAEPSVLRAGVMAGFALVGTLLGRPRSTATLLGAAVLVLLVQNPDLVWSVGFQLSIAATAGMVALAGPLSDRLAWLPRPVAMAAGTTLSAQLGVSPLLLAYFHQVPLVTLVANLLAFPAVSPALLFGLAAAALATILPPVAHLLASVSSVCIGYLEALADRLASAPLPSITSGGGMAPLVVGFGVFGALVWWFRGRRRRGRPVSRPALVVAGVVVPLFVWSSALSAGPPLGLQVRFLDVGQGDAALVTAPDGASILIDGGPDPEQVATDLAALGVKRLDMVVATHPHLDHYTGLPGGAGAVPDRPAARLGLRHAGLAHAAVPGVPHGGRPGTHPRTVTRPGRRLPRRGDPARRPQSRPLLVRHELRREQQLDRPARDGRRRPGPHVERTRGLRPAGAPRRPPADPGRRWSTSRTTAPGPRSRRSSTRCTRRSRS